MIVPVWNDCACARGCTRSKREQSWEERAAILLAGLVGVVLWLPSQPVTAVLVVAVWLFGVVEYVNYFVMRLSYPWAKWFAMVGEKRTPRLVHDLNSGSR